MNALQKLIKRTFMKDVYTTELLSTKNECEVMTNYYNAQIKVIDLTLSRCQDLKLIGAARDLLFEKQTVERLKTEYEMTLVEVNKEMEKISN